MGLALTSGYYLDVNTPLPEPQLSLFLPLSLLPLSNSLHLLIPHLHASPSLGSSGSDLS